MSYHLADIRLCQHTKDDGIQCGSPALRHRSYCYYHMRRHRKGRQTTAPAPQPIMILPRLDDLNAIQVAMAEVMQKLSSGRIDHQMASVLMYGLRIASDNIKSIAADPDGPLPVS